MSKAVLAAQDAAPSAAFELLKEELARRGVSADPFLGKGTKLIIADQGAEIAKALNGGTRMLLLGMSSSPELARGELAAGQYATSSGVPVALWADSWDCVGRKWFKPLWHIASLVFVVDDEERAVAEELFPRARIIASGNPLWQKARYVSLSRVAARAKLGVGADEEMIFCPLTKDAEVNFELLNALVVTVSEVDATIGFVGIHPGDQTDRSMYYEVLGGHDRIMISPLNTSQTLPATDVVLNGTSGVGIEAVAQGIPVCELKGAAITREENRIYPNGWRLPGKYPGLVSVANGSTVTQTITGLLIKEIEWKGEVGTPPTPPATIRMADEVRRLIDLAA